MVNAHYDNLGILKVRELGWDQHTELFKYIQENIDVLSLSWRDNMTTAVIVAGDSELSKIMDHLHKQGINVS